MAVLSIYLWILKFLFFFYFLRIFLSNFILFLRGFCWLFRSSFFCDSPSLGFNLIFLMISFPITHYFFFLIALRDITNYVDFVKPCIFEDVSKHMQILGETIACLDFMLKLQLLMNRSLLVPKRVTSHLELGLCDVPYRFILDIRENHVCWLNISEGS